MLEYTSAQDLPQTILRTVKVHVPDMEYITQVKECVDDACVALFSTCCPSKIVMNMALVAVDGLMNEIFDIKCKTQPRNILNKSPIQPFPILFISTSQNILTQGNL